MGSFFNTVITVVGLIRNTRAVSRMPLPFEYHTGFFDSLVRPALVWMIWLHLIMAPSVGRDSHPRARRHKNGIVRSRGHNVSHSIISPNCQGIVASRYLYGRNFIAWCSGNDIP